MPEYLPPGVYIEETSHRARSIEGVSTATTGFVGPTRYGPMDTAPEVLTSLGEFERAYGGGDPLEFGDVPGMHNYVWHAVRSFFEEGGKRLYVARVFRPLAGTWQRPGDTPTGEAAPMAGGAYQDGHGRCRLTQGSATALLLRARFPGLAGNVRVRFTLGFGQNAFVARNGKPEVSVEIFTPGRESTSVAWTGLTLDPAQQRSGVLDGATARLLPIEIVPGDQVVNAIDVYKALFATATDELTLERDAAEVSVEYTLLGGNDGMRPGAGEYRDMDGSGPDSPKMGLKALEDLEEISIVAAPGSTFNYRSDGYRADATRIVSALISHAENMKYRIAVLDSGDGQDISEVREMRAGFDSKHAALYYPWVRVLDPVTRTEISLPPSGFVTGIYARNDIEHAVHKAPANEVVRGALRFETTLSRAQLELLNPQGVNCFRFLAGRGLRLWGARTISSDPEWKYVNVRRYLSYLERSIDRGTQWTVFESNGEALWANVRRTIEDFLFKEWQNGALLGDKPEMAYFVKCDRSTMSQNDLDNGRLVCLIGVAPLKPAEFVLVRLGQWTADRGI